MRALVLALGLLAISPATLAATPDPGPEYALVHNVAFGGPPAGTTSRVGCGGVSPAQNVCSASFVRAPGLLTIYVDGCPQFPNCQPFTGVLRVRISDGGCTADDYFDFSVVGGVLVHGEFTGYGDRVGCVGAVTTLTVVAGSDTPLPPVGNWYVGLAG